MLDGPRYLAIARVLADDVQAGRLAAGTRLPTHRDLAWRLGVTVGTVSRAYAEAERRGLTQGEVGRGTFVRNPASAEAVSLTSRDGPGQEVEPNELPLHIAAPCPVAENRLIQETLLEVAQAPDMLDLMGYQPPGGSTAQRTFAVEWLARSGFQTTPERIVMTSGAHGALLTTLAAVTRPGDRIVAEEMTYSVIQLMARLLGLHLEGLAIDQEGLLPDAFDAACKAGRVRALYCIPTLHNPTSAIMPADRRREIAEIARKHDVTIVEDDIFALLLKERPPPLASFAPERSYLVTSLSKTVAPGLRVGFTAGPEPNSAALAYGVRSSNWMPAPLMVETAYRLAANGSAERIVVAQRAEAAARRAMALDVLSDWDVRCVAGSIFLWLELPEPWSGNDFCAKALQHGIRLSAAETFTIGRRPVAHAVRLGLGATKSRDDLRNGLQTIDRLLREPPMSAFGDVV